MPIEFETLNLELGTVHANGFYMPQYFNETHHIFRKTVRRFVDKEIKPYVDDWEEAGEFPREIYKKAADQGLLGVGFEPEYGGVESDIFHRIVVSEELMRGGSQGLVAGLFSHVIGLTPVQNSGTVEQKKRFFPPVLAGEKISALAITEPNAGSDVAAIQTKAVRDGDYYIVNGSKTYITSGVRADYLTAAVRTGDAGPKGISLIVIEKVGQPLY